MASATSYSNKSAWGRFWHREGSWRYAYGLRPLRSWWMIPVPVGIKVTIKMIRRWRLRPWW